MLNQCLIFYKFYPLCIITMYVLSSIFQRKKWSYFHDTLVWRALVNLFDKVHFVHFSKRSWVFASDLENLLTIEFGTHFSRACNPEIHFGPFDKAAEKWSVLCYGQLLFSYCGASCVIICLGILLNFNCIVYPRPVYKMCLWFGITELIWIVEHWTDKLGVWKD